MYCEDMSQNFKKIPVAISERKPDDSKQKI